MINKKIRWKVLSIVAVIFTAMCLTISCGEDGLINPKPLPQKTSCEFPKFNRASEPLKTTDEGKCDRDLAAQFGGDCENFHWLGLMGDPFVYQTADGRFHMYFTSGEKIGDQQWRPVMATSESADGILWKDPKHLTKDTVPLFLPGSIGLDEKGAETATVAFDASKAKYHLFYTGDRSEAPDQLTVIGKATSLDGVTWTKRTTPVLKPTLPWERPFDAGGFQVGGVLEPSVIIDQTGFRMWYQGFGHESTGELEYSRFGYATSSDGITWNKNPDPIFRGDRSAFEALGVAHTNVIKAPDGKYDLFYVGIDINNILRIGHARSEDGIHWIRNPNNPIITGKPGEWDAGLVGGPSALYVNGQLWLYYMGSPTADFANVRFALSTAVCE